MNKTLLRLLLTLPILIVLFGVSFIPIKAKADCGIGSLSITYSWNGADRDLDTGTNVFGNSYGWSCNSSDQYVSWSGDNTSAGGSETATIDLVGSRNAGLWSNQLTIDLRAGWYIPAGGSGPATVTINYNNQTITYQINPGRQSNCASTSVGSVTVDSTGQVCSHGECIASGCCTADDITRCGLGEQNTTIQGKVYGNGEHGICIGNKYADGSTDKVLKWRWGCNDSGSCIKVGFTSLLPLIGNPPTSSTGGDERTCPWNAGPPICVPIRNADGTLANQIMQKWSGQKCYVGSAQDPAGDDRVDDDCIDAAPDNEPVLKDIKQQKGPENPQVETICPGWYWRDCGNGIGDVTDYFNSCQPGKTTCVDTHPVVKTCGCRPGGVACETGVQDCPRLCGLRCRGMIGANANDIASCNASCQQDCQNEVAAANGGQPQAFAFSICSTCTADQTQLGQGATGTDDPALKKAVYCKEDHVEVNNWADCGQPQHVCIPVGPPNLCVDIGGCKDMPAGLNPRCPYMNTYPCNECNGGPGGGGGVGGGCPVGQTIPHDECQADGKLKSVNTCGISDTSCGGCTAGQTKPCLCGGEQTCQADGTWSLCPNEHSECVNDNTGNVCKCVNGTGNDACNSLGAQCSCCTPGDTKDCFCGGTKTCIVGTTCTTNANCPSGYTCNLNNNLCTPASCTTNLNCPSGEKCSGGSCVAISCNSSSDCPSGDACNNNHLCTQILGNAFWTTCLYHADSQNGTCACDHTPGNDSCEVGYSTDCTLYGAGTTKNCPAGGIQTCALGNDVKNPLLLAWSICQSPSCQVGPTCTNGSQCSAGHYCCNGQCTSSSCTTTPACTNGSQCSAGQYCCTGQCSASVCPTACTNGSQCSEGQYCCNGQCSTSTCPTTCNSASQCSAGQSCCSGQCSNLDCPGCTTGADCPTGQYCCSGKCSNLSCPTTPVCTNGLQCSAGQYCCSGQCSALPCNSGHNPPFASNLTPTSGDYCANALTGVPNGGLATFKWVYNDTGCDAQTNYELQISTDKDFGVNHMVFDTGPLSSSLSCGGQNQVRIPVLPASTNPTDYCSSKSCAGNSDCISNQCVGGVCVPNCNHINFGVAYYWRVQMWAAVSGKNSGWYYDKGSTMGNGTTDPNSAVTYKYDWSHPGPSVSYSVPSSNPPGQAVIFSDGSICYNDDGSSYPCSSSNLNSYQWTFGDGKSSSVTCSSADDTVCNTASDTYGQPKTYATSLQVCDEVHNYKNNDQENQCCSYGAVAHVGTSNANKVPQWQEVTPFQ